MKYKIDAQNCQNFAFLLYRRILVDEKDPGIPREERQTWRHIPNRITQVKTFAKKVGSQFLIIGALGALGAAGAAAVEGLTAILEASPLGPGLAGLVAEEILGLGEGIIMSVPFMIIHDRDSKWLEEMKKMVTGNG